MSQPRRSARRTIASAAALAAVTIPAARAAAQPSAAERLRAGDSAWTRGDLATARAAYDDVLRSDSTSVCALVRRATLDAWDGLHTDAIALYRRALGIAPDDVDTRLALARTFAWAGRYDESVAVTDSVLARDPAMRTAALDAAQTLSWAGRFRDADARYRAWLAAHPDDVDAELAHARTLSWAGELREAGAIYARLAANGSVEARKGSARVAAWRGDLRDAVAQWKALSRDVPNDPETWTGLAQALRWQGRAHEAHDALTRALRERPGHRDALEQLRWVDAELGPSVTPTATYVTDSDRSATRTISAGVSMPTVGPLRTSIVMLSRTATLPGLDARSDALRGSLGWVSPSGVSVGAELGASRGRAENATGPSTRVQPLASVRAAVPLAHGASLEASVSRAAFDETAALIRSGIATTAGDMGVSIPLPAKLSASASGSVTRLTGGSGPNTRLSNTTALRWTPSHALSVGVAHRAFRFDHASSDGYFAPERFSLAEANARVAFGGELGWHADAEAGFGRQTIVLGGTAESHGAARGALTIGYRPSPRTEIGIVGEAANVAPPDGSVGGAGYRAQSVTLRARVPLGR